MVRGPRQRVPFRRRRECRTDYRSRLALLKSNRPRAVIRCSNRQVSVQLIQFELAGDRVLAAGRSSQLRKLGWQSSLSNLTAAYLTGFLAGKRALKAGVTSAVLDIGLATHNPGNRLYAGLKGLLDAGVKIPHAESVLPAPERLQGRHLNHAKQAEAELAKVKAACDKM